MTPNCNALFASLTSTLKRQSKGQQQGQHELLRRAEIRHRKPALNARKQIDSSPTGTAKGWNLPSMLPIT